VGDEEEGTHVREVQVVRERDGPSGRDSQGRLLLVGGEGAVIVGDAGDQGKRGRQDSSVRIGQAIHYVSQSRTFTRRTQDKTRLTQQYTRCMETCRRSRQVCSQSQRLMEKKNQRMKRRDGISGRTPPRGRTGVGDGELCLSTSGDQGNAGEDRTTEHGEERLKR
jgi:hypothetical protein